jgi:hypothetical protein
LRNTSSGALKCRSLSDFAGLLVTARGTLLTTRDFGGPEAEIGADMRGLHLDHVTPAVLGFVARAGANPKEVSVRAGHSSVAFTLDPYGHLYEDAEDEIPERLDALYNAVLDALYNAHNARQRAPKRCFRWGVFGEMSADLRFYGWPQRDLNPCYRH